MRTTTELPLDETNRVGNKAFPRWEKEKAIRSATSPFPIVSSCTSSSTFLNSEPIINKAGRSSHLGVLRRRLSHPPRRFSLVPTRNFYPFSSPNSILFPPLVPFFPSSIFFVFFFFFPFFVFHHSLYTRSSHPAVSLHGEANATNTGLIVNEKSLHFRVQILVPPPRRSRASYPLPFQPLLLPILCLLYAPRTNSVEIPLDRCRSFSSRLSRPIDSLDHCPP